MHKMNVKFSDDQLRQIEELQVSLSTALRRGIVALHEIFRAEQSGGRIFTLSGNDQVALSIDDFEPVPSGRSPTPRSIQLDNETNNLFDKIGPEHGGPFGAQFGKSTRVRTILEIYLHLTESAKIGSPWLIDYGSYEKELRIPGFGYHQPLEKKQRWTQRFQSREGRSILKSYCSENGFDWINADAPNTGSDDTLFVAQSIMIAWFNKSPSVRNFVESDTFKSVVSIVRETRRKVFSDDVDARKAYDLLQRNDEVLSIDGFVHLNRYFGGQTSSALEEREVVKPDQTFMQRLLRGALMLKNKFMLDPRILVQLWRYESLDCRTGYWVKRLAKQNYRGELSPLVDMAFRLLSRAPGNVWDRFNAFDILNNTDRQQQESSALQLSQQVGEKKSRIALTATGHEQASVSKPATLEDRIEYLSHLDDWGWHEKRPWIFSLDQQARHFLLEVKLNNLMDGQPLKFSYAAYDVSDGVPTVAWSDSDTSVQECGLANVLVNMAAGERRSEQEDLRRELSRSGRLVKIPQKNGYLLVAHTLKRIFALLIWSEQKESSLALQTIRKIKKLGVSYEYLPRDNLAALLSEEFLVKLETAYESQMPDGTLRLA